MPDHSVNILKHIEGFQIKGMMMRYNLFLPRLYNWCKSLGFEKGKIMPSRAFCSDESQGYPIIMIAKHFGTFPFNHGRVGGIVAADRHGPHAAHGQDLIIIQASHVGYDPQSKQFGHYRRLQTTDQGCGPSCGKINHVMAWYQNEYQFAQQNILLQNIEGNNCVIIDNQLLRDDLEEGLMLNLNKFIESDNREQYLPIKILSTAKIFKAAASLVDTLKHSAFNNTEAQVIGSRLSANMFYFKRKISEVEENIHHLEHNLIPYIPQIITAASPMLTAAQINTQIEFDRTFRSIVKENDYQGKKVLFISGLNIDISPADDQLFPLTKFIPWAAFLQEKNGTTSIFEQHELAQALQQQSIENSDQINLEDAIGAMSKVEEIKIDL